MNHLKRHLKLRLHAYFVGLNSLSIVMLFLSFSTSASGAEVELYQSCVNLKGAKYTIPSSRAEKLPKWTSIAKAEPPLSVKEAALKAAKYIGNVTTENLFSMQLSRAFNTGVWYYIVTYKVDSNSDWSVATKSVTLLMDGSVVEPMPSNCR